MKLNISETHTSTILTYISLSLSFLYFNFLLSEPLPLHISLFLTEINRSLLIKSPIKLDTLDISQPWPSAQMVTVKTKDPCNNHSNLYLFLSLYFCFCLFSLDTSLLLYFCLYFIYFLSWRNLEKKQFYREEVLFQ